MRVGAHTYGDEQWFAVTDTGIGIPEDQQPFVFDRFASGARPARRGAGASDCPRHRGAHGGASRWTAAPAWAPRSTSPSPPPIPMRMPGRLREGRASPTGAEVRKCVGTRPGVPRAKRVPVPLLQFGRRTAAERQGEGPPCLAVSQRSAQRTTHSRSVAVPDTTPRPVATERRMPPRGITRGSFTAGELRARLRGYTEGE